MEEDVSVTSESPAEEPAVHTAPILPEFAVPDGFARIEDGEIPFKLEYESETSAYGFGDAASDVIYVTAYLLPEDRVPENYQQMAPLVAEYDEASANEIDDSVTTRSITHGRHGVFRYAEVRDSVGANAYQRNFFVFEGRLMVHLSCQWQAEPDAIKAACQEISASFSLPNQRLDGE
ncbi:hypothetical protein GCM10027447_21430 [Glycomyces halotolerans]